MKMFKGVDTMFTPVYSPSEVSNDPQMKYRDIFDRERKILNLPVKFMKTTIEGEEKAPEKGENTSETLNELGYKEEEIENLKKDGII